MISRSCNIINQTCRNAISLTVVVIVAVVIQTIVPIGGVRSPKDVGTPRKIRLIRRA